MCKSIAVPRRKITLIPHRQMHRFVYHKPPWLSICELKVFAIFLIIKEEQKKMAAQLLLSQLQKETSLEDLYMKKFSSGYSGLKNNAAIHLVDKAKIQIDKAQRLIEQLIQFYDSGYQSAN